MSDLTGLAAIAALQAGKVLDSSTTKDAMWMSARGQSLVLQRNNAVYWMTSNKCIDYAVAIKWRHIVR